MKVTFTAEKETKNTVRFKEVSDTPVIGLVYIPKKTLQEIGYKDGDCIVMEITVEK